MMFQTLNGKWQRLTKMILWTRMGIGYNRDDQQAEIVAMNDETEMELAI